MTKHILFPLLLCVSFLYVQAQESELPPLERQVTVNYSNEPVEKILTNISHQAGFIFSYSPGAINDRTTVSIHADNKPVKLVLSYLFNNNVSYKPKGKYVILKKNSDSRKKEKTYEGYVYDIRSGKKLIEASIYDKNLLVSAVTDKYGYFKMEVPYDKPLTSLTISKLGYSDTLVTSITELQRSRIMEIALNSQLQASGNPSLSNKLQRFIPRLLPHKLRIHSLNLHDSIFRNVQLSVFPFVSTNLLLTGNIENDISLNMTVGYIYGVKKAEFGGIINMVRTDAGVCQLAGVGNIVGGNSVGFQAAGVVNYVRSARGVQAAGVINIANESCNVQLAGVANATLKANFQAAGVINRASESNVQLSGVLNSVNKAQLFQAAGVLNHSKESKAQLAGVINIAENKAMVQTAGFANVAFGPSLVQVAGCMNVADETNVQVSAFINKASLVKKLQFSLINIADSCSGIPVGFINFVKKGYHKLEFSYDETSSLTASFRSGVQLFHPILFAGISTVFPDKPVWAMGYGIGTSLSKTKKLLFDIDLSSQQYVKGSNFSFNNHLFKTYLGIDRRIANKFSLMAGISYNFFVCDTKNPDYQNTFSNFIPWTLSNHTFENGFNLRTWIGWKIGFRFF